MCPNDAEGIANSVDKNQKKKQQLKTNFVDNGNMHQKLVIFASIDIKVFFHWFLDRMGTPPL